MNRVEQIMGTDLGRADALATAALAMGRKGIDWLAGLPGHESAVVTRQGEAFRSEGLPTA
jgi:FAD:protein FMN transferase